MPTLDEMATKGANKLAAKKDSMIRSWNAMKQTMISDYSAQPFGPTRKANYTSGINNANYPGSDPEKWRRNWIAKMSQ